MLFFENIRLALTSIKVNKMRSFLTMLGIIIGISSVIAITSIGASAQGAVGKEFENYGAGYMYLQIDWQKVVGDTIETSDLFTEEDVDALLARFPQDLLYIAPFTTVNAKVKLNNREASLLLYGVDKGYNQFNKNIRIIYGRMINQSDVNNASNAVVLDAKAAEYLYGREDVVGKTFTTMDGTDLVVVGVYKMPPSIFSGMMTSGDYTCYVPFTQSVGSNYEMSFLEIYANPDKDLKKLSDSFAKYITLIKNKEEGFYRAQTAESQLSAINKVLGVLSVAIGAIAAISLLVGGIGIMNIMLVSVTERTREIGIRKSLGARTRDILTQFLIEAMILSLIGGILGTLLGLLIAGLGMLIMKVDFVVQISSIIIAVLFSAGVGLFFGLFPAKKAARMDPIEALRYE